MRRRPTGVASEAEYLSLALTARQAETQVCQRLNAAMPDGIDVIDVTERPRGGLRRIVVRGFGHLEASEWQVVLPGVGPAAARAVTFLDLGRGAGGAPHGQGRPTHGRPPAVVGMSVGETGPTG